MPSLCDYLYVTMIMTTYAMELTNIAIVKKTKNDNWKLFTEHSKFLQDTYLSPNDKVNDKVMGLKAIKKDNGEYIDYYDKTYGECLQNGYFLELVDGTELLIVNYDEKHQLVENITDLGICDICGNSCTTSVCKKCDYALCKNCGKGTHIAEPLRLGCANGNVNLVKAVLSNQTVDELLIPTWVAASRNHLPVVKILLEKRSDLANKSLYGIPILNCACDPDHYEVAITLLNARSDPNICSEHDGASIIHIAANEDNPRLIEYLMKTKDEIIRLKDINMTMKDGSKRTAMHLAATAGNISSVKVLAECGALFDVLDSHHRTPCWLAAQCGKYEVVSFILDKDRSLVNCVDHYRRTLLHAGVEGGDTKTVQILLEMKADTSKGLYTRPPILSAVISGKLEIVRLLLEYKASPNEQDITGLSPPCASAMNGHKEVLELLVIYKADLSLETNHKMGNWEGNWKCIHLACQSNKENIVEYLIKLNVDINDRMMDGRTPLHISCHRGYLSLTRTLIENSASLTIEDNNGNTPLETAIEMYDPGMPRAEYLEIVMWISCYLLNKELLTREYLVELLKYSKRKDKVNNWLKILSSWTGFHAAVYLCDTERVIYLLQKGLSVTAYDLIGFTPLRIIKEQTPIIYSKDLKEQLIDILVKAEHHWNTVNHWLYPPNIRKLIKSLVIKATARLPLDLVMIILEFYLVRDESPKPLCLPKHMTVQHL